MADEFTNKILLFSLIVNIVFPVFAYSFTDMTGELADLGELSISEAQLFNAGIVFTAAQSLNVTYEGGPATFNISDALRRINWFNDALKGDRFRFYRPSIIELGIGDLTGDYFSLGGESVYVNSGGNSYSGDFYNSTMVLNFDSAFNWTRVDLFSDGFTVLFTTIKADDNNITKAVYETGILTATIGELQEEGGGFNFAGYVSWYFSMIFTNTSFGLPSEVNWIMRIFTTITLFAAISVAREFLPF